MTQPQRGFDLYRQSLSLPEPSWAWLETEAARRGCTRSEHADRLAADPEILASLAEIDRRLGAGEPLDDVLGPGITADEFRRQYLDKTTQHRPEETPDDPH